ncbi:hypothetical protein RI129_007913 [Pyrocoelia pectoralis]|uniref:MOSC domain-containing protein n=1 Tax=Pyrocoelia pectoralis TaxID=417401 RepID=A0AAN7VC17_9COLE
MAPQYTTQVTITAGAVVMVTAFGYYLYRRARNRMPQKWDPIGTVTEMYMYPLKSGRRIEIQKAKCTGKGFQSTDPNLAHFRDRCLVIYQEDTNEVKSAKNYPKILLIEAGMVDDNHFCLTTSDVGSVIFKVPELTAKRRNIRMYKTEILLTVDCGDEVAEWVSNYILNEPNGLRLGFHDGTHDRDLEKYYPNELKVYPKVDNSSTGLYSDMVPLHLLTKSSVKDLQSRIPNSNVTTNNFRPNIVIDGENIIPYAEDNWDWIKIGDIVTRNVMLCPRCALTTINPETATFSKDYEPITTMKKYRSTIRFQSEPPSPNMGVYARVYNVGEIRVGDTVYIGRN